MALSENWPAPAKLNLMLRIVGQRSDGYHELQTVFQFLDRADLLSFKPTIDGEIHLKTPIKGVPKDDNLVVKAAIALKIHSNCKQGAEIYIDKRLPMGGGIGGGSSNAATTLVALNHLWDTRLSDSELRRLGVKLGADVPIFIHAHAAWAEGIGEKLSDLELNEPWYLVITPQRHVSTRAIFRLPELTRNSPRIKIRDFLQGDRRNDCLPVVRSRYAEVADALDWLSEFGEARLTGTGASVFAEFSDPAAAESVYRQLPERFSGFVAKGHNHSPLLQKARGGQAETGQEKTERHWGVAKR